MSKKVKLIKAGQSSDYSSTDLQVTDWKLCCLCQKEDGNPLQCPINSKNNKCGYESLATNLLEFKKIESMPMCINLGRLDDGQGIAGTLRCHEAVYHKSCYLKFANDKLKRAQKRSSAMSVQLSDPMKTRRSLDTSMQEPKCFFCNESGGEMHKASTENIDSRVRECATKLCDTSLLAKLATSDMHALDAQYHRKCLIALYNRMRKHCKNDSRFAGDNSMSVEAVALAELVSYMEESALDEDTVPVYKLSDLIKLYTERLRQLGVEVSGRINSTRFKNRLLTAVPDLRAHISGKEVLLTYDIDIGTAISFACEKSFDSDAIILAKAAKIVRRELFEQKHKFNGSFNKDCQKTAVPDVLLSLMRMILEGPNIKHCTTNEDGRSFIACVLSQLVIFNSFRLKSSHSDVVRHNADKETPLPTYLGLMLHAATRKRDLIDKLHKLGLSISYDRVLQISTELANTVCALYEEEGVVCPPNLKKDVFTTAAVDNIDHNPSSTTASDSFHGTAVSLTNHLSHNCPGVERNIIHTNKTLSTKTVMHIPSSYSTFPPAILQNKNPMVPQLQGYVNPTNDTISEAIKKEHQWLDTVAKLLDKDQLGTDDWISWAAFHAKTQPPRVLTKANVAVMPLFHENAQSVAMIKHAMMIAKDAIQHLNHEQVPVIAVDQPLYAIAKQIQWARLQHLGEESFVVMLGGLHIEMAVLSMLGKWLEGSGWSSVLVEAGIATSGRAEALLSASHVKRTRYAHQVTAASLQILKDNAYKDYCTTTEAPLSFTVWCNEKAEQHPQFYYWSIVMELELLMNMFIRSLREGNFSLYVDTLNKLAPWFFALDHVHYARWLPVHIRDMVALKTMHPSVYSEFQKGHFIVQRSVRTFSGMALDQSHEQSNKCIKGDGGVVGLTEDPAALRRWMLAGPEISRVVAEFEESMADEKIVTRHHEQTTHHQTGFAKDVNSLIAVFNELGNPFLECSKDLLTLTTKDIMDEDSVKSILSAKELGIKQHETFVEDRIAHSKHPITDTLPRNNLSLFHNKPRKNRKDLKSAFKATTLKKDCQLFSRLYIACQSREADLEQFFAHENQPLPPSLSSSGKLRIGTKSDLLPCLETLGSNATDDYMTGVTVKIIDGAAIVNMIKPKVAKNFGEYAENNLIPFLKSQLENVKRLDVVWDQYVINSLKEQVRSARGEGSRRRVLDNTTIPKNWASFLHNSDNKKELFCFLSQKIANINAPNKEIYTTHLNNVLSTSSVRIESSNQIDPCNHEEADTRMLLHAAHAARHGHSKVVMRTVDTDVVVLAISQMHNLPQLLELWLEFGVGKHYRVIPVHSISVKIGPEKASGLSFFHALTGCDTTSSFAGRGKKTAWDIWNVFPEVTPVFSALSTNSCIITNEMFEKLERYVVLLYSKTSEACQVNEARQALFVKGTRSLENIPPTKGALIQHVRRAAFQAGYIWGQALVCQQEIPPPTEWGWEKSENGWVPKWTELPEASAACQELIRCGCKKSCQGLCKCFRSNLSCTTLCACAGHCSRQDI